MKVLGWFKVTIAYFFETVTLTILEYLLNNFVKKRFYQR